MLKAVPFVSEGYFFWRLSKNIKLKISLRYADDGSKLHGATLLDLKASQRLSYCDASNHWVLTFAKMSSFSP